MAKFIDPTRSPLWPRWLTPLIRPVERWLLIDRLNARLAELGDDAGRFVREMARIGGEYELDGEGLDGAAPGRCVVFANHPLGGADVIAALAMMERLGTPYQILATDVILAPAALQANVIPIDNSETSSKSNIRQLRRLVRSLQRREENVFVFPAGHCSVFSFRRGVSDIAWKDAFVRLAAMSGARLVPVWFSGRNSVRFYLIGYFIGRLRSLLLPVEFFGRARGPRVFRMGRPIEPRLLPFFGDAAVEAMRASVYGLATRPGGGGKRAPAPQAKRAADGVTVAQLAADEVRRDALAVLRRRCGEDDAWSPADAAATHLVAIQAGAYVGACRLCAGGGSTLASAFAGAEKLGANRAALEFDRLVIDPSVEAPLVAGGLFAALREALTRRGGQAAGVGVLTLDDCDPVLAEAQFEFVRRLAPSARTARLRPKVPLVTPSRHHAFSAAAIRYKEPPHADALPDILRAALAGGLRFGASARGGARGDGCWIVATLTQSAAV